MKNQKIFEIYQELLYCKIETIYQFIDFIENIDFSRQTDSVNFIFNYLVKCFKDFNNFRSCFKIINYHKQDNQHFKDMNSYFNCYYFQVNNFVDFKIINYLVTNYQNYYQVEYLNSFIKEDLNLDFYYYHHFQILTHLFYP